MTTLEKRDFPAIVVLMAVFSFAGAAYGSRHGIGISLGAIAGVLLASFLAAVDDLVRLLGQAHRT